MLDKQTRQPIAIIKAAFNELLPDIYVPVAQSSKLKDGTRIYRIAGHGYQPGHLFKGVDGKIYYQSQDNNEAREIPRSEVREASRGEYWFEWEWHVLDLGPERVEAHLTEALNAAGFHVDVRVGARFGGTAYNTSIAVRMLGLRDQGDEAIVMRKSLLPSWRSCKSSA